jgi:hypothetical protein
MAARVTTIRDAWAEDLRQSRALRARTDRGEIPGPRLVQAVLVSPAGGPFAPNERPLMERAMWRTFGIPTVDYASPDSGVVVFAAEGDPGAIRDAVDRAIDERGAEAIKVYDLRCKRFSTEPGAAFLSEAQLGALVDRARARGVPTLMHHDIVESFRRGIRAGVDSLDHIPHDQPLGDDDLAVLLDSRTTLTPTLWLTYAGSWRVPGSPTAEHPNLARITAHRDRTYTSLMEGYWIPELHGPLRATYEAFSHPERNAQIAQQLAPYASIPTTGVENVRRLHAAGARLATGNDAGGVLGTPAMVREELALFDLWLNDADQPRPFGGADALRAATLDVAQAAGLNERLGSIDPGKSADLVVVPLPPDDDPDPHRLLLRPGAPPDAVLFRGGWVWGARFQRAGSSGEAR